VRRFGFLIAAGIVSFGWASVHAATFASPGDRVALAKTSSPDALRVVQAAANNAMSGTAAVRITVGPSTAFGTSNTRVVGEGTFDFRVLEGAVSFRPSKAAVVARIVFAPQIAFIRPTARSGPALPAGKSWIVAGLVGSEALSRNFPRFVVQAESVNPGFVVGELASGATSASRPTRNAVDGRPATRFDVVVDANQALARAAGPAAVPFRVALTSISPATTTARVWVTDDARLARVAMEPPGVGIGTETVTLSRFDAAVQPGYPSPAMVTGIGTLTPSGERENANGGDSDGG
jgi:hypothetical protein